MRKLKRRSSVALALAGVVLLVSGCTPSAAGDAGGEASTVEPTSPSSSGSAGATGSEAINALELEGPSKAETVPDMEPVVADATPTLPATVTDATGQRVAIRHADRILALDLYGTLTDTIIGLGLSDRLVGRSNSDTQDILADLPVVTQNGHDLNVEAVLSLEPDLVLTNTTIGSDSDYKQLEAVGVTVVRFEQVPHLDGIRGSIEAVGEALGVPGAAATLADHVDERLDEARETIDELRSATPRPPRAVVLYVRGTAGVFFVLGADYGAADVIEFLGLEDVAAENGITSLKPANAEALVKLNPEIVLAMSQGVESTGGVDGLVERPGMAATVAGQKRRVVTAADSQLLSYGPRTPQSLLALARAIYTDNS